jgi:hypothetical protein
MRLTLSQNPTILQEVWKIFIPIDTALFQVFAAQFDMSNSTVHTVIQCMVHDTVNT